MRRGKKGEVRNVPKKQEELKEGKEIGCKESGIDRKKEKKGVGKTNNLQVSPILFSPLCFASTVCWLY